MTDPNTISEHRGTTLFIALCVLGSIGGQIGWPLFAGWNYWSVPMYAILTIALGIGDAIMLYVIRQKVWSNDLSPNSLFYISTVTSMVLTILPVIWHAGWLNHNLQ